MWKNAPMLRAIARPTRALAAALLGLGMLFSLAAPARAVIMTYTLTGNITGSLGATNFSNTPFTWTQTGDTAAPTTIIFGVPALAAITSTIQIGVLPLDTPSTTYFMAFQDLFDRVIFEDFATSEGLAFIDAALNFYNFLGIGPLSVTLGGYGPINTNQGLLIINVSTAPPTNLIFTATERGATIPEPASLALLATGLLGLGLLRRRG